MMGLREKMKQAGIHDVSDWGEKDQRGAYDGPLNIAGEMVDLDQMPALSENDKPKPVVKVKA